MSRNRGEHDESDYRHLVERNKALERKLKSLIRENERLKKEKSRWQIAAENIPYEDDPPEKKRTSLPLKDKCKHCNIGELEYFELPFAHEVKRYAKCLNAKCRKRGRVT